MSSIFISSTICAPAHREAVNKARKGETRIPTIGLAYAVMMHQTNQQLSRVQRMNTMILCHAHAEKMVSFFLILIRKLLLFCLYIHKSKPLCKYNDRIPRAFQGYQLIKCNILLNMSHL